MPVLFVFALGGISLAAVFGVLAFAGGDPGRGGISRSLQNIEQGYSLAFVPTRDRSFAERVGAPLEARLGGLGRALTPTAAAARLQRQLDLAGNPVAWPVSRVVAVKGVALVLVGVLGGFLGLAYVGGVPAWLVGTAAGALAGFFGPDLLIYNHSIKRQVEIRLSLPDVLDTLTISVEAGLGFDAALAQVARNGKGPMAGEAARVLQEMQIGRPRLEAIRSLATRTTVDELRTFASAVAQAGELGVPIANVLREQSKEMRIRRRQRAEEQAQKVPIKILFPTLFCLFPALFVVVIGPGVISIVHAFSS